MALERASNDADVSIVPLKSVRRVFPGTAQFPATKITAVTHATNAL